MTAPPGAGGRVHRAGQAPDVADPAATAAEDWRPVASPDMLRRRARLLRELRAFLDAHGLYEVQTPLLAPAAPTDLHIHCIGVPGHGWLQPSPEFAMKRLLAAGSGDIYQLGPVFRAGEAGRRHAVEFTMLEWYRIGMDAPALRGEIADLLRHLLPTLGPPLTVPWRSAFLDTLGVDPLTASAGELDAILRAQGIDLHASLDAAAALDLLFDAVVAPSLPRGRPVFVTAFPAAQAALAMLDPEHPECALRFELFVDGVELANGYQELLDADELERRGAADRAARRASGLPDQPVDSRLLAAHRHGLPPCSGVALGVDRLLMCQCGLEDIAAVQAFPAG